MSSVSGTPSTVDGVRAVELYYRPIKRIATGANAFYQSQMRLNTPSMGTLLPETFLSVAESSEQCSALFRLGFVQLLRTMHEMSEKGTAPQFASIYMPVRYLLREKSPTELIELCTKLEVEPNEICFELSTDLLFQTDGKAAAVVAALSSEGFRFMMSGFGAAGCPIIGLAPFPMDIVILDEALCLAAGRGERENACVKALVGLASQLGAEIAAPSGDRDQDRILGELGCIYSLSGDYMSSRYAFRKKSTK